MKVSSLSLILFSDEITSSLFVVFSLIASAASSLEASAVSTTCSFSDLFSSLKMSASELFSLAFSSAILIVLTELTALSLTISLKLEPSITFKLLLPSLLTLTVAVPSIYTLSLVLYLVTVLSIASPLLLFLIPQSAQNILY